MASENWQALVEENLALAQSVAWKYAKSGLGRDDPALGPDDLLSLAYEGLIYAAKRFRPELGYKFSTYAVPAITGTILKSFRGRSRGFRVPPSLDREQYPSVTSLDIPVGRGGLHSLGDFLGATSQGEVEEMALLRAAFASLPETLRAVAALRADGRTQQYVADHLGVSQAQVCRLERCGHAALREALGGSA